MVDAMPGCAWGWLRRSRAAASRAAQAGGLGKREAAEPAPCLSHQPGVRRCGINHLALALAVVARSGPRREEEKDPRAAVRRERATLARLEPSQEPRSRLDRLVAGLHPHGAVEDHHPRALMHLVVAE